MLHSEKDIYKYNNVSTRQQYTPELKSFRVLGTYQKPSISFCRITFGRIIILHETYYIYNQTVIF